MQIFSNKVQFSVRPAFCCLAGILILLLPFRWIFAWFLTALIHELAHLFALNLLKIQVLRISIDISGAVIETANMDYRTECICSAAGPLSGIFLIMLGHWVPDLAICALFQTVFNLLPFKDFDGGRILKSILVRLFSEGNAEKIFRYIQIVLIVIIAAAAICCLMIGFGIWPIVITVLLTGKVQKHLANRRTR